MYQYDLCFSKSHFVNLCETPCTLTLVNRCFYRTTTISEPFYCSDTLTLSSPINSNHPVLLRPWISLTYCVAFGEINDPKSITKVRFCVSRTFGSILHVIYYTCTYEFNYHVILYTDVHYYLEISHIHREVQFANFYGFSEITTHKM